MLKIEPIPTSLSTEMWPPWASMTSLTILVPRPVPPAFLLIALEVKRLSRISAGIPRPIILLNVESSATAKARGPLLC